MMAAASRSTQQTPRHKDGGVAAASSGSVQVNLSGTKYTVVQSVAEELGMVGVQEDSNNCDVYWIDGAVPIEKFLQLKSFQKVNHFPGMGEICRKDSLARNSQRMRKKRRDDYGFIPQSWVLPGEHSALCLHMRDTKRRKRNKTFIVKPHNGAMGNGIYLTRSADAIPQHENVVVQEYVDKPFLLDGYKCDLRIYVLVTSCNPLRVFIYKDGLVRLSTQHYTPPSDVNLDQCFMHLTNYSVNKHSDTFDNDECVDRGSKRSLQHFLGWLQRNGYSSIELWARIHDVIVKTLILAHPHLVHMYSACRPGRAPEDKCQCFEILGFDILLDHTLKPWLLEVNRSPSLGTDAPLDLDIKSGAIRDAFGIIDIKASDRKRESSIKKAASKRRLLQSPPRSFRSPYDFLAEQEGAAYDKAKKRQELRERLQQIRREKEAEEHEELNKGDYVRIFPTPDPVKAQLYTALMEEASQLSILGKSGSAGYQKVSCSSGLQKLQEHELLDLLSQYEDDEGGASGGVGVAPSWYSGFSRRPSTSSFQPLALQDSSPMEAVYAAMALREREEEQTQRTMIALNEHKPSYPSRSPEEVQRVLEELRTDMEVHKPNIASFWLVSLDNCRRKQLLAPLYETVKGFLHCYWRTSILEPIRLYQILSRLFAFLTSKNGQGLWSTFSPLGKTWESVFKAKSEVISVTEMVCCRRIVALSQSTVMAAYYYHHLHKPSKGQRPSSTLTKSPSLPSVTSRKPSLTSRPAHPRSHSYAGISTHSHHSATHSIYLPHRPTNTAIRRRHFVPRL